MSFLFDELAQGKQGAKLRQKAQAAKEVERIKEEAKKEALEKQKRYEENKKRGMI
ncbi:MAG TPA: hypothetical protein VMB52_04305 [Verrucomicrobiae bacterium]|nr:hypothetical protein [Verrucomicrobiae bacterium]